MMAHLRAQQRRRQLQPFAKKEKEKNQKRPPGRPPTSGEPTIRSPTGWNVEICLPLPPNLSLAPEDSNRDACCSVLIEAPHTHPPKKKET